MVVLIALLVVGTIGIALWHIGKRPIRYRQLSVEKLAQLLQSLMLEPDGAVLFIDSIPPGRFLQVMKYEGKGMRGIQLDLPRAPWSEAFYADAKRVLASSAFELRETQASGTQVVGFVSVDFSEDVDRAADILWQLGGEVLGLDMKSGAEAHIEVEGRHARS